MQIEIEIIEADHKRKSYVETPTIDAVYKMIEETYLGYKEITLERPIQELDDNVGLGDFLTYILAYPKGIETPVVHIQDSKKKSEGKNETEFAGRPIVCFSGGVDSTGALLHLLDMQKNPAALWCDYGQPYNQSEKSVVEKISRQLDLPLIEAKINLKKFIMLGKERFGHVFPARNLLIATIALAFFPSEIVLAGLCDELVVPDKSIRMYDEFTKKFQVSLYSPFINMTKTDVLCVWKYKWNKILNASDTVSCYNGSGNCQNCPACAKREVAMIVSGYSTQYPEVFTNQAKLIETHWFSRIDDFMPERRTDMLIALFQFRNRLTETLKILVDKYYAKYEDEIEMRRNHLKELREIVYE